MLRDGRAEIWKEPGSRRYHRVNESICSGIPTSELSVALSIRQFLLPLDKIDFMCKTLLATSKN